MPKNLVVCCDGTGNEFGDKNTNVVRLYSALYEGPEQRVFYDPGVGTFPFREAVTRPARSFQKLLGLAFGVGFRKNVIEAYAYIMRYYEDGDQIFLFGFSRGAYTARVVAALVRHVGVLRKGQENLIPYALDYLKMKGDGLSWERVNGFRKRFSRAKTVRIAFLGLWDTVSSVSWFWDRQVYSSTASNRMVVVIRHALSIDERRAFFRTNLVKPVGKGKQDVKQVWFAGVHSDVGGSYPESESGLSKIALEWMLVESAKAGLKIDREKALEALNAGEPPNENGKVHRSLKWLWLLCEIVPKKALSAGRRRWIFNLGKRRRMGVNPCIHESVALRIAEGRYSPRNLPAERQEESWKRFADMGL